MPLSMRDWKVCQVFALKHHFKLLPASVVVISFLSINVEGFQVIYGPGVEDFPVLQLMGGIKVEFGGFSVVVWVRCHVNRYGNWWEPQGN